MMEKLAQAGVGVHAHPLSLYLPSRTKLRCTLQLRGQIHSPCFISIPMYSVALPDSQTMRGSNLFTYSIQISHLFCGIRDARVRDAPELKQLSSENKLIERQLPFIPIFSVCWIRDILVQIRIRIRGHLWLWPMDPDGIRLFVSDLQDAN